MKIYFKYLLQLLVMLTACFSYNYAREQCQDDFKFCDEIKKDIFNVNKIQFPFKKKAYPAINAAIFEKPLLFILDKIAALKHEYNRIVSLNRLGAHLTDRCFQYREVENFINETLNNAPYNLFEAVWDSDVLHKHYLMYILFCIGFNVNRIHPVKKVPYFFALAYPSNEANLVLNQVEERIKYKNACNGNGYSFSHYFVFSLHERFCIKLMPLSFKEVNAIENSLWLFGRVGIPLNGLSEEKQKPCDALINSLTCQSCRLRGHQGLKNIFRKERFDSLHFNFKACYYSFISSPYGDEEE